MNLFSDLKIKQKARFIEYKNERTFLIRSINELERKKTDAILHLKTNKEKLHYLSQSSSFLLSENRYWEKELEKIETALEEHYEKLRKLTKRHHGFFY